MPAINSARQIDYAQGDVRQRETIDAALDDVDAIIIAIGAGRGDPTNGPEFVDYGGVKNLAEAGAAAGVDQIVLVSSAGVTDEDHVLNRMFDNVLIWKAKGGGRVARQRRCLHDRQARWAGEQGGRGRARSHGAGRYRHGNYSARATLHAFVSLR